MSKFYPTHLIVLWVETNPKLLTADDLYKIPVIWNYETNRVFTKEEWPPGSKLYRAKIQITQTTPPKVYLNGNLATNSMVIQTKEMVN